MTKERLDILLVQKGLAESREKARGLILSASVMADKKIIDKPGIKLPPGTEINLVKQPREYVSRGAYKLNKALDHFPVDCSGVTAIDVGASTGGFTDCLLRRGAAKVFAVDVGYGQMDWGLRNDPRVVMLERKNARRLTPEDVNHEKMDLAVIDVSFISLKLIMGPVKGVLKQEDGTVIALIKPQFEAGKGKVGKGGIIRDPAILEEVLKDILGWFRLENWSFVGLTPSPIKGQKGNVEFLACLRNRTVQSGWDMEIPPWIEMAQGA